MICVFLQDPLVHHFFVHYCPCVLSILLLGLTSMPQGEGGSTWACSGGAALWSRPCLGITRPTDDMPPPKKHNANGTKTNGDCVLWLKVRRFTQHRGWWNRWRMGAIHGPFQASAEAKGEAGADEGGAGLPALTMSSCCTYFMVSLCQFWCQLHSELHGQLTVSAVSTSSPPFDIRLPPYLQAQRGKEQKLIPGMVPNSKTQRTSFDIFEQDAWNDTDICRM